MVDLSEKAFDIFALYPAAAAKSDRSLLDEYVRVSVQEDQMWCKGDN